MNPRVPPRPQRGNKAEQAYAFALEVRKRNGEIREYHYEAITLKLGHDCRYTPDFLVIMSDGEVQLHEVKGFRRDDAMVKLRVCATMYPFRLFLNGQEVKV